MDSEGVTRVVDDRQNLFGFFEDDVEACRGLGILWNPWMIKVEVISRARHWKVVKVHCVSIDLNDIWVNMYGPTKMKDKRLI